MILSFFIGIVEESDYFNLVNLTMKFDCVWIYCFRSPDFSVLE